MTSTQIPIDSDSVSRPWPSNGITRWGGFSLFGAGALLIVFVLLVLGSQQTMPVPVEEMLEDPAFPVLVFLVAAVGEFLLAPGAVALYHRLREGHQTSMMFATIMWLIAVPLFLASRGVIVALSQISGGYTDAASEPIRAGYLTAAELAMETENIFSGMALILLSVGSIVFGMVMLRRGYAKTLAYVAIAAGALSMFAPVGVLFTELPTIIPFLGLILSAIWQTIVGLRLYREGRVIL